MNPESSSVGIMSPASAAIIAVRWLGALVEITMPSASAVTMYSPLSASRSTRLPRSGTPNTVRAATSTRSTLTKPSTMYGMTLPATIALGRMGETSSISIVPVSFSREIEMAVISADTIVSTNATRPGTKRCALSSVGLYRIRAAVSIRSGAARRHRVAIPALHDRGGVAHA